jgi:pimeloyl-ACP methyl ester carboxylesterase
MLARMFGPRSVPAKFAGFPKEMAIRPSQIRASAAETALMIPAAAAAAIAGAGHMVQQSATDAVMAAIDEAAEVLREDRRSEVR